MCIYLHNDFWLPNGSIYHVTGNPLIFMHVPSVTIDNTDMLCMLRNVMIYGWYPGLIIFQDVIRGLIV